MASFVLQVASDLPFPFSGIAEHHECLPPAPDFDILPVQLAESVRESAV